MHRLMTLHITEIHAQNIIQYMYDSSRHLTPTSPPPPLAAVMPRLLRGAPTTPGSGQRALMVLLERLVCSERGVRAVPGAQAAPLLLRILEAECEASSHERAARMLAAVCAADESALGAVLQDQPGG